MTDPRVLEAQQWVNSVYGEVPGFVLAPEDGKTGWDTMHALTRALQVELGITALSSNFGPGTTWSTHSAKDSPTSCWRAGPRSDDDRLTMPTPKARIPVKTLPPHDPSRRSVLLGAAAFTVAAGLSSLTPSPAQALSGEGWDPRQSKTSNGWPVAASENDRRLTSFVVEGLGMSLTVAAGDAAVVLGYVVRRFHYEVAEIRLGELKGYRPAAPEAVAHRSNYFSGSALEIKADMYPLGTTGGFFPAEVAVIRDVLAQCEGVVRWGADNIQNPQESHFELCVKHRV